MPQSLKKTDDSLLIEDFLEHLFVERGLSKNTITSYQGDLHQFKSFLKRYELIHLRVFLKIMFHCL